MAWLLTKSVKKYKRYRQVARDLNHRVMDSALDETAFRQAATLLGVRRGKTLLLDREEDLSAIMDFALHECRVGGKSAYEIFLEQEAHISNVEQEILDGLLSSYTTLFRVESVLKNQSSLILHDLLNEKDAINLMDIGFSRTARPGVLIFARLVSLADFNMTSGACFLFPPEIESYLLQRSERLKGNTGNVARKRFITFFKLNQRKGLELEYQD